MKPTPLFVAMLMAFGAQAASAQSQQAYDATNPWYLGVSGGLTHSSNVYRVGEGSTASAGQSNSDMITTASLLGGLDQRFGRQHLTADGSINANHYQRNGNLNNVGYNGRIGLDWYTIDNISGNFTVGGTRQLGSNNVGYGYQPQYVKNVQTDTYASAVVHKGVVTEWTLDVGADYARRNYSADYYKSLGFDQHDVWIGPSWRPSDRLRLGMDYRITDGEIPIQNNSYKRKDVDFTGTWVASGASSIDWRLSHSTSKYSSADSRALSGLTGQVSWNWRPTGKISLTAQYIHDTGLQNSALSLFGFTYGSYAQDQIVNTLRLYGNYQYSGKVSFGANVSYAPSHLHVVTHDGVLSPSSDNTYSFRDYSAGLSATWQATRGISASCQIGRQWRTGATQLYPYTATSFGCSGQILFY